MKTLQTIFIVLFILSSSLIFANEIIQIQGTVTSETGKPLIGANVMIKETNYGSITDERGYYNFVIPFSESSKEVTLKVGYMGYITQTKLITLSGETNSYDFQLKVNVFSIGPIVVSSQRREENLHKVPISVVVVDRMEIQNRSADRMVDLQHSVPNFYMGTGQFNREMYTSIRGISGFNRSAGQETRASYYIDDVYMGRGIAVNRDLMDLERMEILRGPQGTLFGKNTVSGAVVFTTRKPQGKWESSIDLDAGNYGLINPSFVINAPLSKQFFLRFSGKYHKRDGFIKNLYNNTIMNGWDIWSGRLQMRYLPSEDLDIVLKIGGTRDRRNRRTPVMAVNDSLAPGVREVSHDAEEFGHRDMFGSSLNMEYRFSNNYRLKSITAYQRNTLRSAMDEDSSPLFILQSHTNVKDYHFTQEFRLTSPLYRNYNFVAGLFYFYQNANQEYTALAGEYFPIPYYEYYSDGPVTTNSIAFYFSGNYYITPKISMTGGVRYTYEDKRITWNQKNLPDPIFTLNILDYNDTYAEGILLPKIGINYFPYEQFMLYGSITRGYTSGGWANLAVSSLEYLKYYPEYVTNYETGVKSMLFENRIMFNATGFISKFKNYQVEVWRRLSNGLTDIVFINAGKLTTKGMEIETTVLPWKNLSISAALGYTDARYDEFKNGGGEGIHFDGNRLEFAPEFEYTISFNYQYPFDTIGTFYLRGDWVRKDGFFTEPDNHPTDWVDRYHLLSGRFGFEHKSKSWNVYFWGKNITDELYKLDRRLLFVGAPYVWYGIGSTYGIQVCYQIF